MIKLILSLSLVCCTNIAFACAGCGCSVNTGGIGLLNTYQQNFIHASWQQATFSSTDIIDDDITDIFNTWNLSAKYSIHKKLSILAIQSFKHNVRKDDINLSQTGLGDTRILAYYNAINKNAGQVQVITDVGMGFKLPTGKYDENIHDKNLPENFNAGTGNFAGIIQLNVGALYQEWSIYTNTSYQYNFDSKSGYKYGDQFLMKSTVYKGFVLGTNKIIASVGLQYEYILKDQYANKNEVQGTGGNGMYGTLGIGFQTSVWQCNVEILLPGTQTYVDNEMDASIRTNLEFVYFLN